MSDMNISGSGPSDPTSAYAAQTNQVKETAKTDEIKKGEVTKKPAEQKAQDSLESKKGEIKEKVYKADISRPELKAPSKSDNLSVRDKKAVEKEFAKKLDEKLQSLKLPQGKSDAIREAVMNPDAKKTLDPVSKQAADKLSQEVTAQIQKQFALDPAWTITNQIGNLQTQAAGANRVEIDPQEKLKIQSDYQQTLMKNAQLFIQNADPRLSPEILQQLKEGLRTNQPSQDVAIPYTQIVSKTIEEVRTRHLLPVTWQPRSELASDWKVLPPGSVDPVAASKAEVTGLVNNSQKITQDMAEAVKKILMSLDKDDSRTTQLQTTETSMFKILSDIEKDKKKISLSEAIVAEKISKQTEGRVKAENDLQIAMNEINKKNLEKKKTTETALNVVKILATVLAVYITVIIVIFSIATFAADVLTVGATLALKAAIVPILIGLAFTMAGGIVGLVTVILDQTGTTAKIMSEFTKWVNSVTPPNMPQWQKDMIGFAIMTAVILVALVVTIALTVATKGASKLATTAINKIVFKAILSFMTQQIITLATMAASNVISMSSRLVVPIAMASGKSEQEAEMIAAYVMIAATIAFTVLVAIVTIGSGIKSGSGKGNMLNAVKKEFQESMKQSEKQLALIRTAVESFKGAKTAGEKAALTGEILGRTLKSLSIYIEIIQSLPIQEMINAGSKGAEAAIKIPSEVKQAEFAKSLSIFQSSLSLSRVVSTTINDQIKKTTESLKTSGKETTEFAKMITQMMQQLSQATSNLYQSVKADKK